MPFKLLCACVSFSRLTLLELLFAQLQEEDSEECGIPPDVARFVATSFVKGCGAVLTLATGSASSDEVHIVHLTDVYKECVACGTVFAFLTDKALP